MPFCVEPSTHEHIIENWLTSAASASNRNIAVLVLDPGAMPGGGGRAASATGWKNAVMIGAEAGRDATTNNAQLLGPGTIDTPVIFIGSRAGRDSDNISNSIFIGTDAGYLARSAEGTIFIGESAGTDSNMDDSIGMIQ